jgi:glycosyltransferase involved in cell wall biosynthesis
MLCTTRIIANVLIGIDASRATTAHPTGTELYSREIIRALLALLELGHSQHHLRLYTRGQQPNAGNAAWGPGLADWAAAEIVPIDQPRLWTHIGLAREIEKRPPDVLFVPAHVLPLRPALQHTVRTVVTIHDVGYRYFPQAHPLLQRMYLDTSTAFSVRHASAVLAVSEATKRDVMRYYRIPAHKITVTHEGVLPVPTVTRSQHLAVLHKFGLAADQPYFLHIGTLQPRKNLHNLLAAYAAVRGSIPAPHPNVSVPHLVLAGAAGWGNEAAKLKARAREARLLDFVHFTGYIDATEKAALLRNAFAYVCPSRYEGFGLPVLEAQSVGVPVLCSDTSSLPEIVGDGALRFNPAQVQAIAAALQCAVLDVNLRENLIAKGLQNVRRFSWQTCAQKTLQVIEAVAGKK